LEVHPGLGPPAARADDGDRLAGLDPVAALLEQRLVISVEAQIPLAVVDHDQEAVTLAPLREAHAAARDRANRRSGRRLDEHAGPGRAARARFAIFPGEAPGRGPSELASEGAERLGGDGRQRLEQPLQLGDELLELFLLGAQTLETATVARDARVELGHRRLAPIARRGKRSDLARLLRRDGLELRRRLPALSAQVGKLCELHADGVDA